MMLDVNVFHSAEWMDVGVHPTPEEMVSEFAAVTMAAICSRRIKGSKLRVLDACAGDGRLGKEVCSQLVAAGYAPHLVLVDTRPVVVPASDMKYTQEVFVGNILDLCLGDGFDLVVSNPPYEQLNVDRANELGLSWSDVRLGGRNLYGMVMSACLDMCTAGGVCSFIAPQGWIRNALCADLRSKISSKVSDIRILASQSRRLFPSVVQDTAIQVMALAGRGARSEMVVKISYDRSSEVDLALSVVTQKAKMDLPRVRVGPLVWNRHDASAFIERGGYRVLYGGNISTDGEISWSSARYAGRRRVRKTSVPLHYISKAPFIAIKRVMRGGPGAWVADVVAELDVGQECIAENHVIVVELPSAVTRSGVDFVLPRLKERLESAHKDYGHPNLSVAMVREVVSEFSLMEWGI